MPLPQEALHFANEFKAGDEEAGRKFITTTLAYIKKIPKNDHLADFHPESRFSKFLTKLGHPVKNKLVLLSVVLASKMAQGPLFTKIRRTAEIAVNTQAPVMLPLFLEYPVQAVFKGAPERLVRTKNTIIKIESAEKQERVWVLEVVFENNKLDFKLPNILIKKPLLALALNNNNFEGLRQAIREEPRPFTTNFLVINLPPRPLLDKNMLAEEAVLLNKMMKLLSPHLDGTHASFIARRLLQETRPLFNVVAVTDSFISALTLFLFNNRHFTIEAVLFELISVLQLDPKRRAPNPNRYCIPSHLLLPVAGAEGGPSEHLLYEKQVTNMRLTQGLRQGQQGFVFANGVPFRAAPGPVLRNGTKVNLALLVTTVGDFKVLSGVRVTLPKDDQQQRPRKESKIPPYPLSSLLNHMADKRSSKANAERIAATWACDRVAYVFAQ